MHYLKENESERCMLSMVCTLRVSLNWENGIKVRQGMSSLSGVSTLRLQVCSDDQLRNMCQKHYILPILECSYSTY
jgi:hypothetical protein